MSEAGHAPGASAGALLVAAREMAGLSVEAVAQQLKLAPRQVRALEQGDFGHLPGRTFVRGFIRNYARLVRVDPEYVLAALPGSTAMLDAPTLQPTAPTMGELPTAEAVKAPWTRWAIPISLAAVVAAAAVYEWAARPAAASRPHPVAKEASAAPESPPPAVLERTETLLPNPLATTAPAVAPPSPDPAQGAAPSAPEPAQGSARSFAEPLEAKGPAKAP